jgi:hypothetical protein
MDPELCDNYKVKDSFDDLNIGYAVNSGLFFTIIPSLSLITNLGVIITQYKRSYQNKKQ